MYEHNYNIIDNDYQVFELSKYHDGKLFPLQWKQAEDLGITAQFLNVKYQSAAERTKKRGGNIPDRYQFYRALIHAIQRTAAKLKLTHKEVINSFDIHATNLIDYDRFQLLPREVHRKLHSESDKRFVCQYCRIPKPVKEFSIDRNTKEGVYRTCKACRSRQVIENRKLRKETK